MCILFILFQSRHVAASSHKLRDTLRNKFGGESFDQMAFKAELYNKFEAGTTFLSSEKNSSHVKFRWWGADVDRLVFSDIDLILFEDCAASTVKP